MKLNRILFVLFVNCGIFLVLLLVAELMLGTWLKYDPYTRSVTCYDSILHHAYCPALVHRRFMAKADGGQVVDTFVDRARIEVSSYAEINESTRVGDFDVILIGDSFLQAEELPFEQRISAHLRQLGVNALQVGYSSWSPLVMRNWLQLNPPHPGAHVYLMVMSNDFAPNFGWSELSYSKLVRSQSNGLTHFTNTRKRAPIKNDWQAYAWRNSFLLSRGEQLWRMLENRKKPILGEEKPLIHESAFAAYSENCEPLQRYSDAETGTPPATLDYFELARPSVCWSEPTRESTRMAVATARDIEQRLRQRGVSMSVVLIPAGWAFEGENIVGKQAPAYYRMAPETLVTHAGLAETLAIELVGMDFIDLEPVIRELKAKENGQAEQWYFPVDGHWTAHAQRQLAGWLADHYEAGLPRQVIVTEERTLDKF